MIQDLRTLVEIESPSRNADQIRKVGDVVEGWLTPLGARSERITSSNGDHRLFRLEGVSQERILILAHADTVWEIGTLNRLPFRIEEDRAYGPGSYDMKGGVVQAVYALRALQNRGPLPCHIDFLLTSDEEIGSRTSYSLIQELAQGVQAVLVIEPSNPGTHTLKTSRKGVGDFYVTVQGRAAHAGGQPEKGINAILELAHQVLDVTALANPPRGTTINVGVIHGGTASNVVPAEAWMHVDLRVTTLPEAERVEEAMRNLQPFDDRAKVTVTGGLNRPPFERTEGTAHLYELARTVADTLGFEVGEAASGGGSDGNFTASIAPTLDGLGACGDGAHAEHEHVIISEMPRRAALLAGLILALHPAPEESQDEVGQEEDSQDDASQETGEQFLDMTLPDAENEEPARIRTDE
ncbi:carboxypeptidase [Deinococcus cellulosilyticus NBRC 106333 = KACC 11606]|uniref:Carboxypeptidase n=2 Tax=Deinococcus cellulosilyticus TaxID=401558 RepID=A0A511MXD7_DEIC1|nr:carboxypeptidase [Deinococcus cellulosilyticus NBRC 106333 = KACC 11606]